MSVCVLMAMPVMEIGIVRVPVHQRLMPVPMAVRLALRVAGQMRVLMVRVVSVPVFMLEGFMRMFMLVAFREMQPQTKCHQSARRHQPSC